MSARVCARIWLLVAVGCALGLGASRVAEAGATVPADEVTIFRSYDRSEWLVTLYPPAVVDWRPPTAEWWTSSSGTAIRLPLRSLDGRRVNVWQEGLVLVIKQGESIALPPGEPLQLTSDFTAAELCAGPVEIAVSGVNAAGEETLLRVTGEVTKARWLRRHCKAVR